MGKKYFETFGKFERKLLDLTKHGYVGQVGVMDILDIINLIKSDLSKQGANINCIQLLKWFAKWFG